MVRWCEASGGFQRQRTKIARNLDKVTRIFTAGNEVIALTLNYVGSAARRSLSVMQEPALLFLVKQKRAESCLTSDRLYDAHR